MKTDKVSFIVVSTVLLAMLLCTSLACQQRQPAQQPQYPYYGPGHMMGPGGMMGPWDRDGGRMMGPGGAYRPGAERLTIDQAADVAKDYLVNSGSGNLKIDEIMEFEYNFYVEISEKDTGIGAFEALIDPYTGDIYPEPGPNMMWNTRYGMMSGMMWGRPDVSGPMPVTEEQATKTAQEFIDGYLPGAKVDKAERFHGYYTLHVVRDSNIYGMLSVNGYTGQAWYHFWHGPFVGMREL